MTAFDSRQMPPSSLLENGYQVLFFLVYIGRVVKLITLFL
jgi:hypothetical protein